MDQTHRVLPQKAQAAAREERPGLGQGTEAFPWCCWRRARHKGATRQGLDVRRIRGLKVWCLREGFGFYISPIDPGGVN